MDWTLVFAFVAPFLMCPFATADMAVDVWHCIFNRR